MTGTVDITSGTEDLRDGTLIDPSMLGTVGGGASGSAESIMAEFFPDGMLPSFEAIKDKIQQASGNIKDGGCCNGDCQAKPLVSKVIDADGNAKIIVIYDGCSATGGGDTAAIVTLLDNATASDVVDVTIAMSVASFNNGGGTSIWKSLSLLGALKRCKAKVITRAGSLCSLIDTALWLSGRERVLGPAGLLLISQPRGDFYGTLNDTSSYVADTKLVLKELLSFIVDEKKFLTQEEVDAMFENNSQIFCFGEELKQRVAGIQD